MLLETGVGRLVRPVPASFVSASLDRASIRATLMMAPVYPALVQVPKGHRYLRVRPLLRRHPLNYNGVRVFTLKARPCDELIIRSTESATPCAKRQQNWVLAACVLGSSMAFIDSSVVNVALPKMESELGATLSAMTWVINSYTLCMSALLLVGGALADQVGRRRIFITGLSIFAAASIGCGLAPDVSILILARAVQGVGAALLIPCSLAIIGAVFDEKERGRAIGVWSGASAVAAGGGPLLGGWLVDHTSWRAIFLINPIVAIPTILIALRRVPESVDPEARKGLDLTGAALAFLGLGSLVYGLIAASDRGWSNPIVVCSLLTGVALLVGFVVAEARSRAPMMPLEVFRSPTFSGINILTLLLYGALGGTMFFLPFLLIQVHGYSATEAGAVFLPFTILLALLSRWGGGLADRFGARIPLIVGPAIVGIGFFLLTLPGTSGSYWSSFLLPFLVLGFGMSITVAPLTTTVLNSVAAHQTGVASGINNAVAQVASLLLIAILSTVGIAILNRSLDEHLTAIRAAPEVLQVADKARKGFVMPDLPAGMPEKSRKISHAVIAESFVDAIRRVLGIASALALASAVSAVLTIRTTRPLPTADRSI
jgi:EmrB/QacA subfamily drug resistance transporter